MLASAVSRYATILRRGLFCADEVGWVAADAEAQAVALGAGSGRLADAHVPVWSLGLLAAHPRLRGALGVPHFGLAQSAYWRGWDGSSPLFADDRSGPAAVVFLGWRGRLVVGPHATFAAELGAAVLLAAEDVARLAPVGPTGPFLAVRYAAGAPAQPAPEDTCLWPQAWCVAG
jgi:hypothetical protein